MPAAWLPQALVGPAPACPPSASPGAAATRGPQPCTSARPLREVSTPWGPEPASCCQIPSHSRVLNVTAANPAGGWGVLADHPSCQYPKPDPRGDGGLRPSGHVLPSVCAGPSRLQGMQTDLGRAGLGQWHGGPGCRGLRTSPGTELLCLPPPTLAYWPKGAMLWAVGPPGAEAAHSPCLLPWHPAATLSSEPGGPARPYKDGGRRSQGPQSFLLSPETKQIATLLVGRERLFPN